jgi:hypothetical protein
MRAASIVRSDELTAPLHAAIVNDAALLRRFDAMFARAPALIPHGVRTRTHKVQNDLFSNHISHTLVFLHKHRSA